MLKLLSSLSKIIVTKDIRNTTIEIKDNIIDDLLNLLSFSFIITSSLISNILP